MRQHNEDATGFSNKLTEQHQKVHFHRRRFTISRSLVTIMRATLKLICEKIKECTRITTGVQETPRMEVIDSRWNDGSTSIICQAIFCVSPMKSLYLP